MEMIDFTTAIEMVTCTDSGRVRSHNEDSVLVNPRFGLAVLADGMGGYNAGEVASGMATTVLGSELVSAFKERSPQEVNANGLTWAHEVLVDVIGRTNAAIHTAAQTHSKYAGMGTTLVMVQFFDNRLAVAHVGDSRLYRLRGDTLERLTRDHSLLQEQIDSGMITPEQARYSMNKNLVTRGLGVEMTVDTEVNEYGALPGDIYLLCSDGLNDMVEDDVIAMIMSASSSNLPMCASQLVQKANDNGGRDNVSVILAKIKEPFPALYASGGWKGHLKSWFK
jgi:serine/threonine protein phosphatase PrpC